MIGVNLTVYGEPKGQPRQRHFAMKINGKYTARAYTPGTAEAWKSAIALEAKAKGLNGLMFEGPVKIEIFLNFQRPKSHFGTGKNAKVIKASAPTRHTQKPDADNVAKAALDALTHVGVWRDDSQVDYLVIEKRWTEIASYTTIIIYAK